MSTSVLAGILHALGIEPERVEAAMEVARTLEAAEDRPPLAGREWLTVKDLHRLTGFSEYKIKKLRRDGEIPMFLAPDSNEWRMTPAAFVAWERRVVEERTPMEAKYPAL